MRLLGCYFIITCIIYGCTISKPGLPIKDKSFGSDSLSLVEYNMFTKLRGTELIQPATLYLTPTRSLFEYSKGKEGLFNQNTIESGVMDLQQDGWWQDPDGSIIYKDFTNNRLSLRSFVMYHIPYISTEPQMPSLNWQIQDSIKRIGKYNCQQALVNFRGRNYNAWFTTEIPYRDGPWKFQGLPGLILEVTDNKGEVGFFATTVKIPQAFNTSILKVPENGKIVNWESYKKAEDEEFAKLQERFKASNQEPGSTVSMTRNSNNLIEKFE